MQSRWYRDWFTIYFLAFFCLLAGLASLLHVLGANENFHSDTVWYLHNATGPFEWFRVLSHYPPPGFSLYLRVQKALDSNFRWVGISQVFLYVLCVGCFVRGLLAYSFSRARAAAIAAPIFLLPLSDFAFYPGSLGPDGQSCYFAVAATGFFLCALSPRARWSDWAAASALLFLASIERTVYEMLIPALLALGILSTPLAGSFATRCRQLARPLARWTVVLATPLFLYCALRWVTVGSFSMVTTTGFNSISIALQLLDSPTIARLPADLQPAATELMQIRDETTCWYGPYRSPLRGSYGIYGTWFRENIDCVMWNTGFKAASRHFDAVTQSVPMDNYLNRLAKAILWQRKTLYARWVALNSGRILMEFLALPAVLLMIALVFVLVAADGVLRLLGFEFNAPSQRAVTRNLCAFAVFFFLLQFMTIALLGFPHLRYELAAGIFVPSAVLAALLEQFAWF